MREHGRSIVMIVVGGVFVVGGLAMSMTPGEPFIGLIAGLFGFAVLVTGVATYRADDSAWRGVVLLAGGIVLGIACLTIVILMLSPDSSLWESRRAGSLFWASIAGVLLFLVGGSVTLVVAVRGLLRDRQ